VVSICHSNSSDNVYLRSWKTVVSSWSFLETEPLGRFNIKDGWEWKLATLYVAITVWQGIYLVVRPVSFILSWFLCTFSPSQAEIRDSLINETDNTLINFYFFPFANEKIAILILPSQRLNPSKVRPDFKYCCGHYKVLLCNDSTIQFSSYNGLPRRRFPGSAETCGILFVLVWVRRIIKRRLVITERSQRFAYWQTARGRHC